jgi:hypothetical protein
MARFAVLVSLVTLFIGGSPAKLLVVQLNPYLLATVCCCELAEGGTNR